MEKKYKYRISEGFRIDPQPKGIMLVSEELGGVQIPIAFSQIQPLINELIKIQKGLKYE